MKASQTFNSTPWCRRTCLPIPKERRNASADVLEKPLRNRVGSFHWHFMGVGECVSPLLGMQVGIKASQTSNNNATDEGLIRECAVFLHTTKSLASLCLCEWLADEAKKRAINRQDRIPLSSACILLDIRWVAFDFSHRLHGGCENTFIECGVDVNHVREFADVVL